MVIFFFQEMNVIFIILAMDGNKIYYCFYSCFIRINEKFAFEHLVELNTQFRLSDAPMHRKLKITFSLSSLAICLNSLQICYYEFKRVLNIEE